MDNKIKAYYPNMFYSNISYGNKKKKCQKIFKIEGDPKTVTYNSYGIKKIFYANKIDYLV